MTVEQVQSGRMRLLHRTLHAGSWTLVGYGYGQALRFAGNLILTRLLFPEAFGAMALIQSVLTGLTLLSDLGLSQAIIQNARGHTAAFLNTAWTVQVIRGVLIWVATCVLALPVASFYHNHEIALLLPAIGLTALFGGFTSTNLASANRNLGLATITLIDIGTSTISLAIAILCAWMTHSIWSFVISGIAASILRTLASHVFLDGIRNRFTWDIESLDSLIKFGSWIFVSSAVTFLVGEGNRLLIGGLLGVRELSYFTLASTLCLIPFQFAQSIGSRVLFPAFSELVRERPERLFVTIQKARLVQIIPYLLINLAFIFVGQRLIGLLYDPRYQPVGSMLELFALAALPQSLIVSYGPVLWAKGQIRTNTVLLMIQLAIQTGATIIGAHLGGSQGLIVGMIITQWLVYPFHAAVYSRLSLWQPGIDLPVIGLSLLVTILRFWL